ncbi:hypothetical protein ACV34L_32305, partial [Pseudomonas aeruginosa]
ADLDYGALRLFPGNYDEYMTAAEQARERLLSDNAKKKAQIAVVQVGHVGADAVQEVAIVGNDDHGAV